MEKLIIKASLFFLITLIIGTLIGGNGEYVICALLFVTLCLFIINDLFNYVLFERIVVKDSELLNDVLCQISTTTHNDITELLLKSGADINYVNGNNMSPIHYAIKHNRHSQ